MGTHQSDGGRQRSVRKSESICFLTKEHYAPLLDVFLKKKKSEYRTETETETGSHLENHWRVSALRKAV